MRRPMPPAPVVPAAPPAPTYGCEFMCRNTMFSPVCSVVGNEYDNACLLNCYGDRLDCATPCPCAVAPPPPTPTPAYGKCDHCFAEGNDPVCVDDEQTYQNECFALCEGNSLPFSCSSSCPC